MELNIQNYVFETPLYAPIVLGGGDDRIYISMFSSGPIKLDGYCIGCGRESVFHTYTWGSPLGGGAGRPTHTLRDFVGTRSVAFRCQRDNTHEIFIYTQLSKTPTETEGTFQYSLQKVGQFPSHADIAIGELKQFSDTLTKVDRTELVRAVGLAAHGVNIGAFVYLRRIFERQLADAADRAKELDRTVYNSSRVNEKIGLISNELPPFMVRNARVYSVLSKGIHELDEISCGQYYNLMLRSVRLMLEQDQERKRRVENETELSTLLSGIKFDERSI